MIIPLPAIGFGLRAFVRKKAAVVATLLFYHLLKLFPGQHSVFNKKLSNGLLKFMLSSQKSHQLIRG